MADRKDKHKESQNQFPQLPRILPASMSQKSVKTESSCPSKHESSSSVVPFPGHFPIPVANRYSPLGTIVGQFRPNYQSALVSSYDPFQLSSTATPISSFPKSSPYVHKSNSNLFIIEPHIPEIMSPAMIAKDHFPNEFHFLPQSPYKSLKFYREILHETQSVDIKPIHDKQDPQKILFNWETRTFGRQSSVKWWDRFDISRISENVYKDFPLVVTPQLPKQKPSSSHSSQTSLVVEGKSKAELQDIARQLMLQASQMNDDEDIES
ncbi:unnamed protein product [Prunus brigantina]